MIGTKRATATIEDAQRWIVRVACIIVVVIVSASTTGCAPPAKPQPRTRPRIAVIRERPDAARLSGIGPIRGYAKGRDNTFTHCLELTLQAVGEQTNYDELMGISGLAFRTQFRVDRWDVGNPDPLVGENCLETLFSAIGWDYRVMIVRRDELTETESLRQAIRKSIDQGLPVLAANIIPPEDWGIITGYESDRKWLCRSYNRGAERLDRPATGWPTAVVLLTAKKSRLAPRSAHAESIRRAVLMFEQRKSGSHALGEKAFDYWCQALRSARDHTYVHANFWTYIGLIDARGAAVRYLRTIAQEFGPREIHVMMAADWYDKEVRLLLGGLDNVPPESRFPDSLPPMDMRNRQIDILRQAQTYERDAIASLKKAI